ncbi:hypothetical protein [Streptomyces pseudovenezuelae]|uniref:Alpha/beta hydrolase n=1 Tax=Streptomyces pseudovenezuelae TaxID=67350 RepID=A0ABT6M0P9_9ACTN|nr:hypothetical protein [Streptomyces pseudovenezuelae]MDH6222141.1 hypothetical protein [Streptomyces pseudovenezuelae]
MTKDRGTLIVLEFPGVGTAGRTRSLRLERLGRRTRYLFDEVRPRSTEIGAYARELFRHDALDQDDIELIVAYCGATSIARHLADHCWQETARRPGIVALNPEDTPAEVVSRLLAGMLSKARVPEDLKDGLTPAADTVREVMAASLPVVEALLTESYTRPPLGLGSTARQLAAMQADWLAHETAACDPAGREADEQELHVLAQDHPCPADCPARHTVTSPLHSEFFSMEETFHAIAGCLADRNQLANIQGDSEAVPAL